MKVRARLVLLGAVLPSVGTLAAILLAGQLFALSQYRAVDEALSNQAAVESVSLFDGPGGAPHLHVHESPRGEEQLLARVALAVYGPDGAPVLRFPETAIIPSHLLPEESHANPGPRTITLPEAGRLRVLVRNLVSKDEQRHFALWLSYPLDGIEATIAAFYRATLSVCATFAAFLFALQLWQARRLSRRIANLHAQLPRLRSGDFDKLPPPDETGDEIADLRDAFEAATLELKAARERQERLIANAAHELRTPLGLMRTEIDLALRRDRSPEELRAALAEARGEVDRLAELAQSLLDLAALRSVTMAHQPGDLATTIRDAVDANRAAASARDLTIEMDLVSPAPASFAGSRVRQAIDNLLANAIRWAPPQSRVDVTLVRAADHYRIAVLDRGPGVAEADREHIFEPFYRGPIVAGVTPGAGLGLAIVREVAREHGGSVALVQAAQHTELVITLPAPRV